MSYLGARAKLTANKAMTLPYIISWDATDLDTGSFWNIANPTRLTIPVGVDLIRVRGQVRMNNRIEDGAIAVTVYKNGASLANNVANVLRQSNEGGLTVLNTISFPIPVVAGDYIELQVQSPQAFTSVLANETWLDLEVLQSYRGAVVLPSVLYNSYSGYPLLWQTMERDTDALWSAALPRRLTIPIGVSKIKMTMQCNRDASAVGYTSFFNILKNGVFLRRAGPEVRCNGGGIRHYTNNRVHFETPVLDVVPGDYFNVTLESSLETIDAIDTIGSWWEMQIIESLADTAIPDREDWILDVFRAPHSGYAFLDGERACFNAQGGADYQRWVPSRVPIGAGLRYWEVLVRRSLTGSSDGYIGVASQVTRDAWASVGNPISDGSLGYRGNGSIWGPTTNRQVTGLATYGAGAILMFAFNAGTGELWVGKDGVWHRDPDLDARSAVTTAGTFYASVQGRDQGDGGTLRAEAADFTYPIPAAAIALAA